MPAVEIRGGQFCGLSITLSSTLIYKLPIDQLKSMVEGHAEPVNSPVIFKINIRKEKARTL